MAGNDEGRLSFDRDAEGYAAGRPAYPPRVYEFLESLGALGPGLHVLELGPGTGQATQELLRRGMQVTGIELGENLASRLVAQFAESSLTVHVGDIQAMPLPMATYDAVVAATVFHWLDSSAVLPRLAAALKPDGWLAVWWTVFGDPSISTPFRRMVGKIYAELMPDEPPMASTPRPLRLGERTQELTAGGHFRRPAVEIIPWSATLSAVQVQALFGTFPNVAALEPARRERLLTALSDAVVAQGEPVIDPFVTVVYAARVKKA